MAEEGSGARKVLDDSAGAGFVEVMFATTIDEATKCCHLLEDVHIPAQLESTEGQSRDQGIAVLVPTDRFVEASEVLAARMDHDALDDDAGDDLDDEAGDDDEFDGDDADDDEDDDEDDDLDFDDDEDEEEEEEGEF